MTKAELEKATGQELIEQRDYCGVDGYYHDYLDNINEEMLKRFNRLTELEKENTKLKSELHRISLNEQLAINNGKNFLKQIAELKHQIMKMKCNVNTNIKIAQQNKNWLMESKLTSMILQWEGKRK